MHRIILTKILLFFQSLWLSTVCLCLPDTWITSRLPMVVEFIPYSVANCANVNALVFIVGAATKFKLK